MKLIALLIFLGFIETGFAQTSLPIINESNLDFTQDVVSKKLFSVTNKVDTFFGDRRDLEEKNGSYIKFEYITKTRESSLPSNEPNFDVRVRLKNLENKLHFKLSSTNDEKDETLQNSVATEQGSQENILDNNNVYRASLGFLREQKKYWSISADSGIKVQVPPTTFARARGRRSFYFNDLELRTVNKVQIEDRAGLFNYTDINFYKKLKPYLRFSYANKFVWKDSENEFISSHGPSLSQIIDDKQSLGYHIRTRFINKPSTYAISGHEVFTTYRRDMYKKWIFLDITPGISFLAAENYKRTAFFNVKLQALFGDF